MKRSSRRNPYRSPFWAALVILTMLASMFSSLVDPAFAQGDDGGETGEQQQSQQDPPPDRDGDGIPDNEDSCPDHPNLGTDWNGDGIDDACDPPPLDSDGDGIPDNEDSCPDHPNLGTDWNGDGIDDACDPPPTPTATTAAPTETPMATHTPTPGMGMTGEDEPRGSIAITTWFCAPDMLPASETDALAPDCNGPGSPVTYTLNTGETDSANVFRPASFNDLMPGDYTIAGTLDPPASGYVVFCEGDISDTRPYAFTSAPPAAPSANVMGLQPGENVKCDWFWANAIGTVDITNSKYVCPPEYDPANKPLEQLRMECNEPVEGYRFAVESGSYMEEQPTDEMANNSAAFMDVPAGMITMYEMMPPGHQFMALWCYAGDESDPMPASYNQISLDQNGRHSAQHDSGYVRCDWFNETTEYEPNYLLLYKHECALDVRDGAPIQGSPEGKAYYDEECMVVAGWEFEVGPSLDMMEMKQTDTDGKAVWEGLPTGDVYINETLPPDYGPALFFCRDISAANMNGVPQWSSSESHDGTFMGEFTPDVMGGECHVYNFAPAFGQQQVDDLADLYVDKYLCPVGYDYTMPGADPMVDCQPGPNGVTFTLSDNDPNTPDAQSATGDSVDYRVMFGGTTPGAYTLVETLLPEFESSFLWACDGITNGAMTPWSTSGSYDIQLMAGDMITCHWFNIPADEMVDDGFSVTLYKWECPAGTAYDNPDPTYYSGQCAAEQDGVPFSLTDANGTRNFTSDTNGHQEDNVVPTTMGQFILMEGMLDGYGDPVGYCQPVNGPDGVPMMLANGMLTVQVPPNFDDDFHCWYYNIPEDPGMVTIYKWDCTEGVEIEKTLDAHKMNCTNPLDQVTFTLTDTMGPRDGTSMNGTVAWNDVRIETIIVAEHIPLGYSPQPYVSCRDAGQNAMPLNYSVYNGVLTVTLTTNGQHVICDWFNQFQGPGEITVYKWECPVGYDRTAWGADPAMDCDTPYNGVTFTLDQPQDVDLQTNTGDSINGAVYFGGLMPGDYILTEMIPDGIVDVFVLDCVGMDTSYVHPIPLSVGPSLSITVGAGDQIRCDWYNVPGYDPAYGWLTLTKYQCSTPTYMSDIDCLLYSGGQEFDLQAWNGSTWNTVQSGTTNGAGQLTFAQLDPGTYRLTEPGKTACLIKSDRIENGQLAVVANGGTTVKVYNCGTTPVTPKTPTKYPETGVDPSGNDLRTMDGLSLLGLLGTGAVISRRRLLGAAALGAGTIAAGRAIAAQDVVPLDAVATPSASPMATPGVGCMFPATPEATPSGVLPGTPVACARGAVPVRIRIPAITVDAPIEYLEFIEGTMEQPTGETNVAWYKNSARLGEQGNGLYAGHLNWWGVPQAVFFRLAQLPEGEAIEIEGDNGESYRYIVQWKQDFPSDEEPPEETLGHTQEQAITVITCGGEWNSGRAEYDHRTLVRAIRDTEAAPSTPVT